MALGMLNLGGKNSRLLVCDIGTHAVKLADVRRTGRSVVLCKWTVVPLPATEDGDVGSNEPLLIQRLRKAVGDNGWRGRDVFSLISGASMATHAFVMPRMGSSEMSDALRLRLRDAVHFDASDAYLDYAVGKEAGSGQYCVTAVAAEPQVVARARRLMDGAGLRLIGLTSAASALPHLVDAVAEQAADLVVGILDIGAQTSVLSLYSGGDLLYTRDIRVGGQMLTEAYMRPIISSEWSITLDRVKAEQVKCQVGIPSSDQVIGLEHPAEGHHVLPIIQPVLNALLGEIRQSVAHFQRLNQGAEPDVIFIGGGGGQLRNLATLIHNRLGVPVEPVDFDDVIGLPDASGTTPAEPLPLSMAAAVGQALNVDDRPNLLENERKVEKALRRFGGLGSLLTPVAAAVLAVIYWMTASQVGALNTHIAQQRAHAAGLQQRLARIADVSKVDQELAKRKATVRQAMGRPVDYVGILKELSLIVPDNITLAGISVDPGRRDGDLRLDGQVHASGKRSNAVVGQFIKHLEASPYFSSVHPVSYDVRKGNRQAGKTPRFQVQCRLVR